MIRKLGPKQRPATNRNGVYWKAVKKTYREFCEATSIHGLKYTVHNSVYDRVLWITIVLFGLIASLLIVNLFWNRYMSTPTRTSVFTNFASSTIIKFPAVSFCSLNRISRRKIDRFVHSLDVQDADPELLKRALPQLLAFTHPTIVHYNMTELAILEKVLSHNDYFSPTAYVRRITVSCEEMLIKCKWEYEEVGCSKLFSQSYTTDGLCCSFNAKSGQLHHVRRSVYFGPDSGLSVFINPIYEQERYSVYQSNGIKLIVHKYQDYPGIGAVHKFIAIGRSLYVQLSATRIICTRAVNLLATTQRNCAFPGEILLDYFKDYTDSNCYTECTIKRMLKLCKCVPYYYSGVVNAISKEFAVCNISDIPCLNETSQNMSTYQNKVCNCLPQCDDTFYNILSTVSTFPQNNLTTSSFLADTNIANDHILLSVFFSSYSQTVLRRDIITSSIYLISSLGGIFSLFLGCSFISAAEILYYVLVRFYLNAKKANKFRVRNKRREIFTIHRNSYKDQITFLH